jgi:hypothetical protein
MRSARYGWLRRASNWCARSKELPRTRCLHFFKPLLGTYERGSVDARRPELRVVGVHVLLHFRACQCQFQLVLRGLLLRDQFADADDFSPGDPEENVVVVPLEVVSEPEDGAVEPGVEVEFFVSVVVSSWPAHRLRIFLI